MPLDVISYGIASQAYKDEENTNQNVLGEGVTGTYPNIKARIDQLENGIQQVVEKANQIIINDAINIMKANAKFNAVAKTKRYEMQNMIFDDLLDLSGIDTTKSRGYTFDSSNGLIKANANCMIITKTELTDIIPSKVILVVDENNATNSQYFISRDDGQTWESIVPETLFYFHDSISPKDNKLRLKAELPNGSQLLNYAITWA